MSIFQRKLLCDMASTLPHKRTGRCLWGHASRIGASGRPLLGSGHLRLLLGDRPPVGNRWHGAALLALHASRPLAVPVGDPFGVTTPPWLIVSLPPIGVAASLGHAAWSAVRGQRIWRMLATAAVLIAVMGVATLLETHLAAF